jgi:serine/threonine protein kinase
MSTHPLIPKIHKIFNNQNYLFVIKEFVGCITLANLIEQIKLDKNDIQFYIASIIKIIKHLH